MHRDLYRYDPVIGYRFIPGLRARIAHEGGGYLLSTNRAGFRSTHEFDARKPATTRVLLFGDSYTAGEGVSDGQRYGDLLEAQLPGTEVLNLALPGSGTDQQYLIWRECARELEYDLAVIGVLVENIQRVNARYRPFVTGETVSLMAKPYFTLDGGGSLTLHHVPVPREPRGPDDLDAEERHFIHVGGRLPAVRRLVNRLGPRVKESVLRVVPYQVLPQYRIDHPDWRLMAAILRKWVDEIPTPVIIVPIPLYHHVEGISAAAGYQACFGELADPPNVIVHDPLPALTAFPRSVRRTFRFARDCHLTPAAHSVIARSLAPVVGSTLDRREMAR